jgi:hypothetical protein
MQGHNGETNILNSYATSRDTADQPQSLVVAVVQHLAQPQAASLDWSCMKSIDQTWLIAPASGPRVHPVRTVPVSEP